MRARLLWALGIAASVSLVVFVGWLFQSCAAARDTSKRFVALVHEGKMAEARALVGPELATDLGRDTDSARTFSLLDGDDLKIVQSGFGGAFIPFSCFEGKLLDGRIFWILTRKRPEGFRVVELRSDAKPASCDGHD